MLITKEMIATMQPGSVTVDLAAEAGGNIETTVADEIVVTPNGVKCIGYTDMPSRLPRQASQLYGNNVFKFLDSMGPKGRLGIDHEVTDNFVLSCACNLVCDGSKHQLSHVASGPCCSGCTSHGGW